MASAAGVVQQENESAVRAWQLHAGIYFMLVVVHVCFSWGMRYPTAFYDELGYWGFARLFVGAIAPNVTGGAPGHVGYGILIAPVLWLTADVGRQYHLILFANALFMSSSYFPLYYLVRKLTAIPSAYAAGISATVCLYPSYLLFSNFVISENVAVPVAVLVLALLYRLLERPSVANVTFAIAAAGMAYVIHSRFMSLVVVLTAVLVFLAIRRRISVLCCAVAAASFAAFLLVNAYLTDRVLDSMYSHLAVPPPTLSTLFGPGGKLLPILPLAWAGEIGYLLLCTAGLFGAGIGLLVVRYHEWRQQGRSAEAVWIACYLGVVVLVFLGASIFILPQEVPQRPDHLIIGRYNEAVMPVALALGLALLYEARHRAGAAGVLRKSAVATLAVLCITVATVAPVFNGEWFKGPAGRINAFAFAAYGRALGRADFALAAVVAVVGGLAILLLASRNIKAALIFVALSFVGAAGVEYRADLVPTQSLPVPALASAIQRLGDVGTIDYDMSVWHPFFYSTYQVRAPRVRFQQFRSDLGQRPQAAVVIAGGKWADADRWGYRFGQCENAVDNCLWTRTGTAADAQAGGGCLADREIGSLVAPGVRTEGLYPVEGDDKDHFRWTNGHAVWDVHLCQTDAPKAIAAEFLAYNTSDIVGVVNGIEIYRRKILAGQRWADRMPLVASGGHQLHIEIRTGTFEPAPNTRILGVQIRSLKLVP